MPNRASRAGHIPYRTCVVCRKKKEKKEMIRFANLENDLIFDCRQRLEMRGFYVCDVNDCIILLDKWFRKFLRKNTRLGEGK
ncbi:MAG: DUF448 domain-containing protein [Candidatus Cloacimonetes bacterium]|nr:DUF448 domain-containing protein [Candidatus Cloacimonadota bacterium]